MKSGIGPNPHPHVIGAVDYMLSRQVDGVFPEFSQMTRGPSDAWSTACVASALVASALHQKSRDSIHSAIIEAKNALLKLRRPDGGWSYNHTVRSDPDSTARVIQFFSKIGFYDKEIFEKAFKFMMSHQDQDTGGICTYTPAHLAKMRTLDMSRGYPSGGWDSPHACVSAVVYKVLPGGYPGKEKLKNFLLENHDPYWWLTRKKDDTWVPLRNYVKYETRGFQSEIMEPPSDDTVDMSLWILGSTGNRRHLVLSLLQKQNPDGSFPESHIFHLPPSDSPVGKVPGKVRTIVDGNRLFSTAAASVALVRSMT